MSSRLSGAITWPTSVLAAVLLFAMMVVTFVDVICRYLINYPIFGSAEMIQFLLAGTIFAAMPLVVANDGHIAVELLAHRLQKLAPRLQAALVHGGSIAGLCLIGWRLVLFGVEAIDEHRVTIVLGWPIAAVALPCGILCLLAAVLQLRLWARGA